MATSEKYSNFSKTRRSALKGKPAGPAVVYSWEGYSDYNGFDTFSGPVTVYTTSPVLQAGVTLYTDALLTTYYFNTVTDYFYIDTANKVYTDSGNNQTIKGEYNILYNDYALYTECGNSTTTGQTFYVGNGAQYFQGNVVYTAWWDDPMNRFLNSNFIYDPFGLGYGYMIVNTDSNGVGSETQCSF